MTTINAIVKLDVDTWVISCVLTNMAITDGRVFESEADAISFMQAHNLPYTTIHCQMYRGGNVRVEHTFHDADSYQVNAFMHEFTDLF